MRNELGPPLFHPSAFPSFSLLSAVRCCCCCPPPSLESSPAHPPLPQPCAANAEHAQASISSPPPTPDSAYATSARPAPTTLQPAFTAVSLTGYATRDVRSDCRPDFGTHARDYSPDIIIPLHLDAHLSPLYRPRAHSLLVRPRSSAALLDVSVAADPLAGKSTWWSPSMPVRS